MTHPELAPYLKRYVGESGVGEIVVNLVQPTDSWMLKAINPDEGVELQRQFFEQRLGLLRARAKLSGDVRVTPVLERGQALLTGSAAVLYELVRPGGAIERDPRFEVLFGFRWRAEKSPRSGRHLSPRI